MTGPSGRVVGVDMTVAMLARAEASAREMRLAKVELHEALIETLPREDASVDVVISNGVIDLVPDKDAVFDEIDRVLRPGVACSSPTWSSMKRCRRTHAPASTCGPAESPARCSTASTRACWFSGRTPTSRRAGSSTPTRARCSRTRRKAARFGAMGATIRATKPR